jgi:hypothetical protein
MSYLNKVDLGYLNQKSVDGRLRISNQISLGDYKQWLNNASGQFNTELIGGGTASYEASGLTGGTVLSVSANNNAVIRQSYQWHNYFAGKPIKIELTASAFQTQSNVIKRMGYYSSNMVSPFNSTLDGLFFENDGTVERCKIMRAGTEIFNVPRSQWMNQEYLSSFNPANFNFYVIEFLYLGGAIVTFSILTEYGLIPVAQYQHINVDPSAFVKSPNQPVRYEVRSTGGAGTFNQICADVAVEGTLSTIGATRTYNMGATPLSAMGANTRYALLGLRLLQASRSLTVQPKNISVRSTSNDDLLVELFVGGTLVGTPTWTAVPFTNMEAFSGASLAVANAVHSGGVKVSSFYLENGTSANQLLETARRLGSYINGAMEQYYVCVTPASAGGAALASIDWLEFI